MNILIVKLSAIGDVVHTLPSLAALRKLYPSAHITWVVEDAASDLIADHPYLHQVLVFHRHRWLRSLKKGETKVFGEIRQFVSKLRNRRYDLVVDFHGLLKSSLIVLLATSKRKIGFDSMQELSGLFINERVFEDMNKHAVDRYLDLVRHIARTKAALTDGGNQQTPATGSPLEDKVEFCIPVTGLQEQRVAHLLADNGLTGKFVALNPAALWQTKLWDNECFACLCNRIVGELKLPVLFTGVRKQDIIPIQALLSVPSVNMAETTSLRELACLYRHAELVITTDSGPMHIAAAMGTPVVALFGPTDVRRTGPYGQGHRVVSMDISCRPCFQKKCTAVACMRGITVDAVFRAVTEILCDKQLM